MPISHVSKLFAVDDAKIGKLLTDPAAGSATYDTLIDVPGIKNVGLVFDLNSVELRGDNGRMDSDSTLVGITLSFEHAKISLDALAVFLGGTAADTGTTPNMVGTFTRTSAQALSYFKFEARTPVNGVDTTGGDAHLVIHKAKITSYSLGLAEENYQTFSAEAQGVFRIADSKLFDIVLNETAAAIA